MRYYPAPRKHPGTMTVAQLQAETELLIAHEQELLARGECVRDECDGQPHEGCPYPHSPRHAPANSPLQQAIRMDPGYQTRDHLEYISGRIKDAVRDVEGGKSRKLIIEMPPRTGKTSMVTQNSVAWILAQHPDWPIVLASYSSDLATSWSKQVREWAEEGKLGPNVQLSSHTAGGNRWLTTAGGEIIARSIGGGTTGFGAKCLIIDDPHKDLPAAHSPTQRKEVWEWWLGVGSARLHPPSLVITVLTRWHEDDLVGRLLSKEYPGNPDDWEVIRLPAIADSPDDLLGRSEGDPLFSPLIQETREEAIERWGNVKNDVGSYVWSALYQQSPTPAQGSIFNIDTFGYWTNDPERVTEDGRIILLPDRAVLANGNWLDSWDFTFKGGENSDYVVGQRWVRVEATRYLIAQKRGKWDFMRSLKEMELWGVDDEALNPYGRFVGKRLVEDAANGPAIISTLNEKIAGIEAVQAKVSKESRARAVTPEIESRHVRLPDPNMPGYEWVKDLISEVREFPLGAHDDQCDAMTQALWKLRVSGVNTVSVPRVPGSVPQGQLTLGGAGRTRAASNLGRRF